MLDREDDLEPLNRQALELVKDVAAEGLQKLNLRDRVQAVVVAYETGLFDTDAKPRGDREGRPAR